MTLDRKRLVELFRAELEVTRDPEAAVAAVAADVIASYEVDQQRTMAAARKAGSKAAERRVRRALAAAAHSEAVAAEMEATTKAILLVVAAEFAIPQEKIFERRYHQKRFSKPRWVAIWMLRDLGLSMPKIARTVGLSDHTSVIHALSEMSEKRKDLRERAEFLWSLIAQNEVVHVPTGSLHRSTYPPGIAIVDGNKEAA